MILTKSLVNWLIDEAHCEPDGSDSYYKFNAGKLLAGGELTADKYEELTENEEVFDMTPNPEQVLARGDDDDYSTIRVKAPSEKYSTKKWTAKNRLGQEVHNPIYGRTCMSQSEKEAAMIGVLFKHTANRAGVVNNPLNEHEKSLLAELCINEPWCGKWGDQYEDYIPGSKSIKALIDDSVSGGLEVAPIFFDEMLVTFPLLTGELFPFVDLVPVPRGRRVEGASIGTPTTSWGGVDDTAVSLFTTTSLVNAIDTTIFRQETAVRVGLDFMSDSPAQVGSTLTGLVGERFMEEADDVIANGNGSTQPEGIFVASGLTTVAWGGATSIANYESLLFSVPKQYRKDIFRPVFVANDTSYQRARAIPVGSSDARRIFGMDEESYQLFRPYKIQNDVANTTVAFGCLAKYRMYRRKATEIKWVNTGETLARANEVLLLAFQRLGGQIVDTNAWAKTTTAPA